MAEALQDLPQAQGFEEAVDRLNGLPEEILSDICHNVLFYLQLKLPAINIEELKEKCEQSNINIEDEELRNIINVLKRIYRSACQRKVQNTEFNQNLTLSLKFTERCSNCISQIWKENGDISLQGHSHPLFDVGKLVDMQWKLGVAVSSDSCKNLNASFVAMTVKVADNTGKLTTHSFEMSIPQFKNLSKQLQDMAKNMEMV